ncbi:hypothetical protein N7532_003144 [Penicillium argentinense]|uniref:Cell cycle regulatory protein n=1 Tax=Penicillium argentinense TaxID=1131581 RepID=A0A9W9KDM4_9EURO|nr:uncharacterized protein N7532_003144 [Penicillium argentinense]KAJ5102615.1 hypothetical protein N7532_003144 [Penicillium argentinense]
MVDSRCHSLEDTPSLRKHHASLTSSSRSESSRSSGSVKLTESFATINLSLRDLRSTSHASLTNKSREETHTIRQKENRTQNSASSERGRKRVKQSRGGEKRRRTFQSPASPDRFIPTREYTSGIDSSSTPFRVSKPTILLSPRERFLRRRVPGDDPFLPTTRPCPAFPGQKPIPAHLRQRPHQQPSLALGLVPARGIGQHGLPQASLGTVWDVGGAAVTQSDFSAFNGSRESANRGTTAPSYAARLLPQRTAAEDQRKHESRLALALDIDPTTRVLGTSTPYTQNQASPTSPDYERYAPFVWKDNAWKKGEQDHWPTSARATRETVPPKPFRILDAPYLRDDFYCSTLAYSFTSGILAVGLAQYVYLWSEGTTVNHPAFGDVHPSNYVTSLCFSSEYGGRSILAVGRQSGQLLLWGALDNRVRFDLSHPNSISCVSFKPKTTRRNSERFPGLEIDAEELVAGDDIGNVWYYSVEWPVIQNKWSWSGSMTLLAKISAHTQQVCGLAWSPDERFLATGGNDNVCLLFELEDIIPPSVRDHSPYTSVSPTSSDERSFPAFPRINLGNPPRRLRLFNREHLVTSFLPSWAFQPIPSRGPTHTNQVMSHIGTLISGIGTTVVVAPNRQKHRLPHAAAVKAIAFAPWQPTLLATGGGSNDRAIHFFHSRTGVCLATINVFAQVTSLIWSQTRREIVATFGYAQPDHPFRIAVFAWPSCAQVAVIPWGPYGTTWDGVDRIANSDCGRALWAVGYPGRPRRSFEQEASSPTSATSPSSPTSPTSSRTRSSQRGRETPVSIEGTQAVRPKEKEGGMWCSRTMEEGCIIVASSDQTVKFHEVWTGRRTSFGSSSGLLGGSDILESMEGIDKSGSEVIR